MVIRKEIDMSVDGWNNRGRVSWVTRGKRKNRRRTEEKDRKKINDREGRKHGEERMGFEIGNQRRRTSRIAGRREEHMELQLAIVWFMRRVQ